MDMPARHPATFALGGDLVVNRLGFGAMRLTGQPGNFGPYPDWGGGLALLRRAADLGVTLFDTARAYRPQWNERLVAEAVGGREGVVIAIKVGIDKLSSTELRRDASPATIATQVDDALGNLRTERIDLLQLHWVDPSTPIEESVAAMAAAQAAGKVRHIGLANVTADELRRAQDVATIASVQNRYNLAERGDDALVDLTAREGIALIPYGPLGAHPMRPGAPLAEGPAGDGRTSAQEALRALLDRAPNILVIPGTTSIAHLEENMRA